MKNYICIRDILLFVFILLLTAPKVVAQPYLPTVPDSVQAYYRSMLLSLGIEPLQAGFPLEAKQKILQVLDSGGDAVIAGYFYRDLDKNGQFNPGEELGATLLGLPEINVEGIKTNAHFNCYWFDPVPSGKSCKITYEYDGIEPVITVMKPHRGLNIFHIPVNPEKPLVYIVSHSHFDAEWEMTYEQYLDIEIPHIKQRLDLLQDDPAHCFFNDEEIVTRPFVERVDSRYVEMLRQGMIDGMIEPKGMITQSELTMPYGESLIRGITFGERLLSDLLGIEVRPDVFVSIDQYGYGFQIPQIIKKSGRDYFLIGEYLWRDEDSYRIPHTDPEVRKRSEFWLEGSDGSKVLAYREHYYRMAEYHPVWGLNFGPRYTPILPHNSVLNFDGTDFCPPNVNLSAKVDSLNKTNGSYKYIISSPTSFFRAIESCPEIPSFTSECFINYWSGVYESRVEGRLLNRRLENRILATESMATLAAEEGMRYPREIMDEAWYLLLINQNHDPMMSPMFIPGLYEGAVLPRYETAASYIDAGLTGTLNWLTTEITANQQPGTPVTVFNPLTRKRSVVVQASLPSHLSSVRVTDLHGNVVHSQVISNSPMETNMAFLAEELPALGWRTYYVKDTLASAGQLSAGVKADMNLMENEHIRVELGNGSVRRITDKASGTVVFQAGEKAGINEVMIWKDEGCISIVKPVDGNDIADFIDNPEAVLMARSSDVTDPEVNVLEAGPVRGVIQTSYPLDWGTFSQKIILDAGSRVIRFEARVLWDAENKIRELNGRRVRVAFHTGYNDARVFCDIPFGVMEWDQSEQIRPVNSWLSIENGESGAAFCHRGPQSIQVVDDVVYMTLFRSVLEPPAEVAGCGWDNPADEAAENGGHVINYSVYVYPGNWKTARVPQVAAEGNTPVFTGLPVRTAGKLPGEDSYLSLESDHLVVTTFKLTEYSDSGVILRLYNPTGETASGIIHTGFFHGQAEVVNFREEVIQTLSWVDHNLAVRAKPYEILTIRFKYDNP